MRTQFSVDLRLARKKTGYTQADLAILMADHQSTVSAIERGATRPDLNQIITLSLIYGRSFETLFAEVMQDCAQQLQQRLKQLSPEGYKSAHAFNRAGSLRQLQQRLTQQIQHGSA
jgi:transcriptional regulator with XRE-family HTH domain